MKILVTGGAGFIGSNLVDALIENNYEVAVMDDLSMGKLKNVNKKAKFIQASILDFDKLLEASKVDIIFHVAALARVPFSIQYPKESNDANVNGTLNVLLAAKQNNVRRIVYSASSSAYGTQLKLPLVETMNPNPQSPYALQKLIGEYYCKIFNDLFGIETISLRYFNVYGPRQNPEGAYANLISKAITLSLNKQSPVIYGNGTKTRDFTFVDDVVKANFLAAKIKNPNGEIVNIGSGKNYSVNEIVNLISSLTDKTLKPEYKEDRKGEPQNTLASIEKANSILNWKPKIKLEEGLKKTIEYFKTLK